MMLSTRADVDVNNFSRVNQSSFGLDKSTTNMTEVFLKQIHEIQKDIRIITEI